MLAQPLQVRLEPRWDSYDVRRACVALAREMERRHPDIATAKWWKEERTGIFIDYNQNARDKTVSSAYGIRPTGFVSTPFRWDELAMAWDDSGRSDNLLLGGKNIKEAEIWYQRARNREPKPTALHREFIE